MTQKPNQITDQRTTQLNMAHYSVEQINFILGQLSDNDEISDFSKREYSDLLTKLHNLIERERSR